MLRELEPLLPARKPVIVNALRCYQIGERKHRAVLRRFQDFPRLWQSNRYLRFCMEAFPSLDKQRSLYVPYCPRQPLTSPPESQSGPGVNRPISVVFIGRERTGHGVRLKSLAALRRTPGSKVVEINISHPGVSNEIFKANLTFKSEDPRLRPMARANFTLCPPGDTPESERIYHAISQGSIPIIGPAFQRPSIIDWGSMSWPLKIDPASGLLELPTPQQQVALQRGVWRVRKRIDCEASNLAFRDFIEAGLRHILTFANQASG